MNSLHSLSSAIHVSTDAAERAFAELLQLNGQSLVVLRLYAEYELFVSNNADKAALLFAEAERIEDQQVKEHQRETGATIRIFQMSNIDVMAGMCTIYITSMHASVCSILSCAWTLSLCCYH